MACLDENAVSALVERRAPATSLAWAHAHADECPSCRELIAAATRALVVSDAGAASVAATTSTLPRSARARDVRGLAAGEYIGRYRVLEVLGAGGMGVVYGAFDPELQRKVALKLVRPEFAELDVELRARLVREAQAMARIRHPNVITVFDAGTWDDRLFVAMEIIEGGTLATWQAARTRSVEEILRVFAAAGAGLAAAHAVGLVHRDFKPDNILIGTDGRVCVTDFGLVRPIEGPAEFAEPSSPVATVEGELTLAGAVVGTPAYMAPEQMRGAPPDGRADQFSFCVSLFEALYGVRPFPGKSLAELEGAILGGQWLRAKRKGVPSSVRRALARGLHGIAWARFDSMEALLAAMQPKRRAGPALAAAALVAVTAVGIGAAHWRGDRARLCGGGAEKLAGVWDAERRAAVTAAIGGGDRATRVVGALDEYADRWLRAHRDACEATHVRGEQSEALLDLRMQCLDERRKETEELTRILAADRELGDKAAQAVQSLPPIGECADVAALARPRPAPAAVQEKLEAPRRLVARARAELDASKCRDALAHAGDAAARARDLDDPALAAQALWLAARAHTCLGELTATHRTLVDAAVLAARGHDETRLTYIAAQAVIVDAQQGDFADGDAWAALGDDAAAHAGGDPLAEGERLYARAILEWRRGHLEAAAALHRRAASFYDRVDGADYDRLRNLGQLASMLASSNRYAESMQLHRQIRDAFARLLGPDSYTTLCVEENLALAAVEQGDLKAAMAGERRFLDHVGATVNPSHLSTAQSNYGGMLLDGGRPEEAMIWFERALANAEKIDGRHDEETEYALTGIGTTWVARGRPRLALEPLTRALALQHGDETADDHANAEGALAEALWAVGHDRARALTLARHARDYYAKHPMGARRAGELAHVEAWLRAREPKAAE
jgi:eukaryotic-like serine/threonine-protein kinase